MKITDFYLDELRREVSPAERADFALLQSLERDLSGALGASSARLVLTSALRGAGTKSTLHKTLSNSASPADCAVGDSQNLLICLGF